MTTRLCFVLTHPASAKLLLRGQLRYLQSQGFDVTVISSPGKELDEVRAREQVDTISVSMARGLNFGDGPRAVAQLARQLSRIQPDIINASTPKAGLFGMLAAKVCRVPLRVYQLRGLRLEGERGLVRKVLGVAEHTAASCAHVVYCNSESLRDEFVNGGYSPAGKTRVLAGNGIDMDRFRTRPADRTRVRADLGIPEHARVIGFVGRFVEDKGIGVLLDAFEQIRGRHEEAHLLLIGGDIAGDTLSAALVNRLSSDTTHIHMTGRVEDPAPYYSAMDVFAFPSVREGLPNVVLEAAASELAVVGLRATGVIDAIVNQVTGALCALGDVDAFAQALEQYVVNKEYGAAHGRAGRIRVGALFEQSRVWSRWAEAYHLELERRLVGRATQAAT